MVVSDPQYLETRFSNKSRLKSKRFVRPTFKLSIDEIRPFLDQIPTREADFLELYFLLGKNQAEIATIFGVCQGTVCHRLKKAVSRIRFLLSLPSVSIRTMERDLSEILNLRDVRIMMGMFTKTCQSQVAEDLGLSQCYVRHRFLQSLKKIREVSGDYPRFRKYADAFEDIRGNFNILREIRLPRWQRANRVLDMGTQSDRLPVLH